MEHSQYLLAANAAVWIGLAGYIFFLTRKQAWLDQRIQHLEEVEHEQHDNGAA